jgi:hypothetical protein
MPLFSHRKGIRPVQKAIQREMADKELRNRLWTSLKVTVWDKFRSTDHAHRGGSWRPVQRLCQLIWTDYFKEPLDTLPIFDLEIPDSTYRAFRTHFFEGEWWTVYDFLEFVLKNCPEDLAESLRMRSNEVLETENAAYRIVHNEVCEISDEHEINAIEEALSAPFTAARKHLNRCLELLSDKQNPDYRNAVKEAVSALESASQEVSGLPSATLGDCVKSMERSGKLHSAFKEGLLKLYGYTSDSGGIRHALTENDVPPTYSEAKFMLVTCSAFINLLAGKNAERTA